MPAEECPHLSLTEKPSQNLHHWAIIKIEQDSHYFKNAGQIYETGTAFLVKKNIFSKF